METRNYRIDNNPNKDISETTVTLPNGKAMTFREASNGNVYIKGTTQYWTADEFAAALAKMTAAGAHIVKTTL